MSIEERDYELFAQVVAVKEGTYHHCRLMPPAGGTDENTVILVDPFLRRRIRHCGAQVIVCLFLNPVAVVIRILGVRLGCLYPVNVGAHKFSDAFGNRFRVTLCREICHKVFRLHGGN